MHTSEIELRCCTLSNVTVVCNPNLKRALQDAENHGKIQHARKFYMQTAVNLHHASDAIDLKKSGHNARQSACTSVQSISCKGPTCFNHYGTGFSHATGTLITGACRYKEVEETVAVAVPPVCGQTGCGSDPAERVQVSCTALPLHSAETWPDGRLGSSRW